MRKVSTCLTFALLAFIALGSSSVRAQPCPTYYEIGVGESVCIGICGFTPVAVGLIAPEPYDSTRPPLYVIQPGCDRSDTPCDSICRHPTDFCFDWLDITLYYGHPIGDTAAYWSVVIINYMCPDTFCICFTFDRMLPVELMAFSALAGDREVRLNWTTASEAENDHWLIDRATSSNGPWTVIHEEPGQGTVSTETHYSYVDRTVQNGTTYWYRLTDVSIMGARQSHSPISATPGSLSGEIPREFVLRQNFPNPFNPTTTIEFALPHEGFATLKIYDLLGREVASVVEGNLEARWYQVTWNAGNLPSGVYLYTLATPGFSDTRKLLLMK